jgi:hypothetical protein
MVENQGKYYLYRHIRLDKNEPFYIGIGTKPKNATNSEYVRANATINRKSPWKNIVAKTDYDIEILLESDDYEFIKQKEIEFIALYGRRDLNKGTLVNLTDGGEGSLNAICSEETKEKIRQRHTGNRVGAKNHNCKKVINVITKEVFDYAKEACTTTEYKYSTFKCYLNGNLWNITDFMYLSDYEKGHKINENTKSHPPLERQFKFMNTITGEKYKTVQEVTDNTNYSHPYVYSMIYGKRPNKINVVLIDI